MATNFTVDDLIKDFGNYYLKEGQNMSRLKETIRQGSETLERFATPIITEESVFRMANPVFQRIMKPFRKAFEPSGGIDFHPNEIILRQCKADMEVYPTDFQALWLGFLAGDATKTMETWPIIRYIVEKAILEQIEEDRETEVVYNGVYDPDGEQPIDSFDGIKKQLLDGAAHPKYPIHIVKGIGELSKDTIFDQIETYSQLLPSLLRKKNMVYFVSDEYEVEFMRSKRANGFYFISSPDQIDNRVDFTKHVVCGLPSMAGTKDLFSTMVPNLLWLKKGVARSANIDIQKHDRCVHILLDWWEAVGFACNQLVWATEHTVKKTDSSGSGS